MYLHWQIKTGNKYQISGKFLAKYKNMQINSIGNQFEVTNLHQVSTWINTKKFQTIEEAFTHIEQLFS